jgi:sulfite reductase alpha subunit-like flavoprotein
MNGLMMSLFYVSDLNRSSNKMPIAVKDAIRHAVEKEGGKTVNEAREFVAAMERDQKMIEECWS